MSLWTVLMIIAIIIFLVMPSLKTRIIPVRKLALMPIIFMVLFYQTIINDFSINNMNILLLILGLTVGVLSGILARINTNIKADRNQKLMLIPDSYINLIIFLLIFTAHFVVGYLQSTNPAFFHTDTFGKQGLLFVIAIVSSLTIGTSACLFYKYVKSINTSLQYHFDRMV